MLVRRTRSGERCAGTPPQCYTPIVSSAAQGPVAALCVVLALANEVGPGSKSGLSAWRSAALTGGAAIVVLWFNESAIALFAVLGVLPLLEPSAADPDHARALASLRVVKRKKGELDRATP